MAVSFHALQIPRPVFERKKLKSGVCWLIHEHKMEVGNINVIFCSDDELLEMNKKYLQHDYYTDVITFDYSEGKNISGDIFVSIDRIRENAKKDRILVQDEIRRIVGHGVLHLIGFMDKTISDKKIMTQEEDIFLKFFD
ncbi:MAG: rRNA maturation RNase YbeY [Bacteroidota bacterium]|nr:rRNA maturation RNase YbeY [Bacteroidota bacterium]